MIEAVNTSEKTVSFYESTRDIISEDGSLFWDPHLKPV